MAIYRFLHDYTVPPTNHLPVPDMARRPLLLVDEAIAPLTPPLDNHLKHLLHINLNSQETQFPTPTA